MAFTHDTGLYNVSASLFTWLNEQIAANKPPTVNTVKIVTEWPIDPVDTPCWSFHMLGVNPSPSQYQGGNVGGGLHGDMKHGIAEISCWVTRSDSNTGWRKQLRQMCDTVTKAIASLRASGSAIIIKDFYTSDTAPQDTAYKLVIERVEMRMPPVDPNPAIVRRRILVYFTWVERA